MAKIKHIGIILDGNGRWAKLRGKKRTDGHVEGAKRIEELILYINKEKIADYLSLYVFSTENFERPQEEVDFLMNLFMKWFKTVKEKYLKENIKIIFSSQRRKVSNSVRKSMEELEEKTKNNTGLTVNFCLDYGSRTEIIDATKKVGKKLIDGSINIDDITEELIGKNLYNDLPDLDFVIRTSGEERLSNFMLWQASYAEFYFPKTLFPDFTIPEFNKALEEYDKRNRRFGNIK